jgi:putative ABC transport system permease protein
MSGTPSGWRRHLRLPGASIRREVDEELAFHIATRADEYVAQGLSRTAAHERAVREFGDMAGARAQCREIGEERVRRERLSDVLDSLVSDARYALRALRRSRGFAAAAITTLALGIAATTALFTVVRGVLLVPPPYAAPDRIVRLWETTPWGSDHNVVSAGNYTDWVQRSRSFTALGAHYMPYRMALTGDGEPININGAGLSPSVFTVLGVQPMLGRGLSADPSADASVVVLSHAFWRRRYGEDRRVIGRSIQLDGRSYAIVGVMPPGFEFPSHGADLLRPFAHNELDPTERRSHNLAVVGRLAPGVTLEQARVEMRTTAGAIAREHPQFMTGYGVNVVGLHADLVAGVKDMILVLFGGAGLILLIACANIANLLLARAMTREREMAVRGALGAGRGRVVRQLLTESGVLAVLGGVAGIAIAYALVRGLVALAPSDMPMIERVHIDVAALGFAALAAAASAVVFGLVPAIRLARQLGRAGDSLQATLRTAHDRTSGVQHARLRSSLLIGEVALSLVLLVGAGLLVRSSQRLARVNYGYRPDGLLSVSVDLPRARYDSAGQVAFYEQLVERVRATRGVTGVAGTTSPPASGDETTFSFAIEGRPSTNRSGREDPQPLRVVTPDYFRTMGIPLTGGRAFDGRDRVGAPPVAIIDQSLARKHWPNESPVGKRISLVGQQGPWIEIVGVVGDTRMASADQTPGPSFYMPHAQKTWRWMSWLTLIVRAAPETDLRSLGSVVRAAAWEIDPQLPIDRIATVEDLYRESTARRRFAMTLLATFAAVAVLLGMVGMYGVLSYSVAQRSREIGIRMALGAPARHVMDGVLRHALAMTTAGIILGGIAAVAASRVLRTLLYEISPTDAPTFVAVAVLLAVVAAGAAWIPARRATRVDPLRVIRDA